MRGRLLFCIVGTLGCIASAAIAEAPKRKLQPGYTCKIEHRGDFGLIETDFQIFDSGETRPGYIKWDAGDGQFKNPWIAAAFFRQKTGGYALGYGNVSIMRHIWEHKPGKRPGTLKLSLELTTNIEASFGSSRMAGQLERSGGPFHLQLDWPDTAALARGASKLYLVARNSRHETVDRVEIDRMIFARAEPHILDAFAEVERMLANPRELCVHADDLGTDDIVVT